MLIALRRKSNRTTKVADENIKKGIIINFIMFMSNIDISKYTLHNGDVKIKQMLKFSS